MRKRVLDYPELDHATEILRWAGSKNPGPWVHHSRLVASACKTIATRLETMDPCAAEVAGLLHDVGRRHRGTNIRHCTDGYRIMKDNGYNFVAEICISHCFPDRSMASFTGKHDIDGQDEALILDFLAKHKFDQYDEVVQLCDAFTDGQGTV